MSTFSGNLAVPALVLRIGGGVCFLGHGLLALAGKAGFVGLLATFGLSEPEAVSTLKAIGCLDVLVGLLILFKPEKLVLRWAIFWTALTILAWGIHGDSLMDLARRATYMTTPLALLFLLRFRDKAAPAKSDPDDDESARPADSSVPHAGLLRERETAISQLDLSKICMKLMDPEDGEGWTRQQCAEVSLEYRRYLILNLLYPDEQIVPNLAIDTMWHYHILDTQAYQRDCQSALGYFLHHYPYFGMEGKEDNRQFVNAFDRTRILYEKTFGTPMEGMDYLPSFKIRRSA